MSTRFLFILAFLVSLTAAPSPAQPPAASQREAIKKLDFLLGQWKGEGWMEIVPGRRSTFKGTEVVQSKLDGLLLTIDGLHRGQVGGKGKEVVVHNAFAVVSYDERGKRYRFQAFTARGNYEDAQATVADSKLVWGMKIPQFGEVRYTIKLDDTGRWFEIGEISQDGKAWRKFFEMTLERVKRSRKAAEETAPTPPVAKKAPHVAQIHGDMLTDNYFWLREKTSPEVRAYLEAENAYTKRMTTHLEGFKDRLYQEALARIQQTDEGVPVPERGYLYYSRTEKGKQYRISCRKKAGDDKEEVLLDGNELARGHKFFSLGGSQVSDNSKLLAFTSDVTGFRMYYLSVKDLETGKLLEDRKRRIAGFAWAGDNKTLFYVVEDAAKRPYKLVRHIAGGDKDEVVFEEKDELYRLGIRRSRDRKYLFAVSSSSLTTEVRYLPADEPAGAFKVILPRQEKHEYHVDHRGGRFWIRTNKDAKGFRVVTAPVGHPDRWVEVLAHRPGVTVENVILFKDFVVFGERDNGMQQIAVRDLGTNDTHRIAWPEPVYSVFAMPTPEFDTTALRFRYTSLVTPGSVFEYDMKTRKRKLLKQDKVLGGYDPSQYRSERIFATASDGVKVPISLVYRKDTPRDGSAALWLQGYGSYGASIPVAFNPSNLLLLDRGVVVAWAHIRGGGDMGKNWHDDGKMMTKMNTFTDFIACADYLVEQKYGSRQRLAIEGGSAGGLLIGTVLNLRPDLCKVAVLNVPFVDVINTMLDASLPLTIQEYLEWGNPNKKDEYEYIKKYCPYTNLKATSYPAIYVTTSLNDSQVMYWEPAKYVAKLRSLKTDKSPLLFKCNMAGGHGGSSGRYDVLKERMLKTAFVLEQIGIKK